MEKMSTKELQIAERARKYKGEAMTNLHQFIDEEWLKTSYESLNRTSSPGVDGKTWEDYQKVYQRRLGELLTEFKSGKYKAPNIRRAYIPKGSTGMRPLGIPTIEDKILQEGVRRVLTPFVRGGLQGVLLWIQERVLSPPGDRVYVPGSKFSGDALYHRCRHQELLWEHRSWDTSPVSRPKGERWGDTEADR